MTIQRPPMPLVLTALICAELTAAFETTMVFAALKTMIEIFDDPAGVGWLITIYLLVSAAAAAICGRLGDIYGRRRVLLIVLGLAAVGSLVSACASTLYGVLLGRGIQGMAGAIMPLCFGLARENLPEEKVSVGIGVIMSSASIGASAGLIVGGYLLDNFAWNSMFFASAALAGLALAAVWLTVPASPVRRASAPLDLVGGLLFVPAVAGVLLAISNGPTWGWLDLRTLGTGAVGAVLLAFWVVYELRHESPLIDVRLLANRQLAVANVVMALIAVGTMNVLQVLSLLVQQPQWTMVGLGASATVAGLLKLPSNVLSVFTSTWSGWICGRRGGRFAMLIGIGVFSAGWVLLIPFHGSLLEVTIGLALITVGTSITFTAVPSIIVATAPAERTSEATGLMSVIRAAAQGVGVQLIMFLLGTDTISDSGQGAGVFPTRDAYLTTFTALALTGVFAMLAALLLPKAQQPMARPAAAH